MRDRQESKVKTAPARGFTPVAARVLRRTCACGGSLVAGGECAACQTRRTGTLQRSAVNTNPAPAAPSLVSDVLRTPGQPLDAATRGQMEGRFGHDFSAVRVHADPIAARSARAVAANAFAVGQDIVFGSGRYAPGTGEGRRLLTHELTHTLQQRGAPVAGDLEIGRADDQAEREADAVAAGGRAAGVAAPGPLQVRRSPLSDSANTAYGASKDKASLFTMLRNSFPQTAGDPALTAWIATNLKGDDLWLAQQLQTNGPETNWDNPALTERARRAHDPKQPWAAERGSIEGTIGESSALVPGSAKTPIKAYFFPGQTDERALVIGGIHGSELSGIEVANTLVQRLKDQFDKTGKMPRFTTIIVPELYPDTAAQARRNPSVKPGSPGKKGKPVTPEEADKRVGREVAVPRTRGKTPTTKNLFPARQFPVPGQSLADIEKAGGPQRHRTDKEKAADPKHQNEPKRLTDEAEDIEVPLMNETKALLKLIERFRPTRIASLHAHSYGGPGTERKGTDAPGIFVDPRGGFDETKDPAFPKQNKGKPAAGSTALTKEGQADDALALAMAREAKAGGAHVPGNYLDTKDAPPVAHYAESSTPPKGFSLGDWGPAAVGGSGPGARAGMTVITVEVEHYHESRQDPSGARAKELQAHSDALMKVFLEKP